MKELIRKTVENAQVKVEEYLENTNNYCFLKKLRFDNCSPEYSKDEIQNLYYLRYYPAYLFEYKYIYNSILNDRKITNLNIFSIGCGCGLDCHGAYLALEKDDTLLKYNGIDIVNWNFPGETNLTNTQIHCMDIADYAFEQTFDSNVIIFPKSLSDIPDDSFNKFLENIMSVPILSSKYIYLVSNSMRKYFEYDQNRYSQLARILESKGYVNETNRKTQEMTLKKGYRALDSDFLYPDEQIDFLKSLDKRCEKYQDKEQFCDTTCKTKRLEPMLSNYDFSFQINRFKLKDS